MAKNFYNNCLSDELREQLHSHLAKLVPEQLSLNSEVALEKAHLADLVTQWSKDRDIAKACEAANKASPNPVLAKEAESARYRATIAGDRMADAIRKHKDVVLTAATTEVKLREVLTERTLTLFIQAVLELVHEYWNDGTGDAAHLMEQFELELRSRVVVQQADQEQLGYEGELWQMIESLPIEDSTALISGG